jgi:hypothetical protein
VKSIGGFVVDFSNIEKTDTLIGILSAWTQILHTASYWKKIRFHETGGRKGDNMLFICRIKVAYLTYTIRFFNFTIRTIIVIFI